MLKSKGIALLLVLWVLAFLSVIAAEFCRSMRTEVTIARNFKESTQAYYTAVGGFHLAVFEMMQTMFSLQPKQPDDSKNEDEIDWRVNAAIPAIPFGDGQIVVRIDNESGKVNINLADQNLIRVMIQGFDITEEEKNIIVDSILDWRDKDSNHRLNGAEEDYYQSLPNPYHCKNGDFDSVEELFLVRGITSAIIDGGLRKMVTVYPSRATAEKKLGLEPGAIIFKTGFDYNKININAAHPELLLSLPGFSTEIVDAINAYRQEKDIGSIEEYLSLVGVKAYTATYNYITFSFSPYFRIHSQGWFESGKVRQGITAVMYLDLKSKEKYHIVQWLDQVGIIN